MADEGSRRRFEVLGDRAMPGRERAEIGAWVVRADLGATGRANSCWVIGAPETGIDAAIAEVEAWYEQRGLPPLFQVHAGNDRVVIGLLQRGYVERAGSLILSCDDPGFRDPGTLDRVITETPTGEFAGLFDTEARVSECQRTTLPQRFVTVSHDGETAAGGMVVVDQQWAGIFMVRTAPEQRRLGYAGAVMAELVAQARRLGSEKIWLQVMPDNSAAITLYERAGFNAQHAYSYYVRERYSLSSSADPGHNGGMAQLSTDQLNAGAAQVALSPSDRGTVELVLRRPATDQREIMDSISLVPGEGIVGDNYLERGDSKRPDGSAHPEAQICVMNSRVLDLVADGDKDKWKLAGDQIIVDFDLTQANAPAGTRLGIGSAVVEVSSKPHNGCAKFAQRFGLDAAKWANGNDGMCFRGINVMVVSAGEISTGDSVVKLGQAGTGSYPPQS